MPRFSRSRRPTPIRASPARITPMPATNRPDSVPVGPAVGDVRRAVCADSVESPLGEAELPIESVDEVQPQGHHRHGDGLIQQALVEGGEHGIVAELQKECSLDYPERQKDGERLLPDRLPVQPPEQAVDPYDEEHHLEDRREEISEFHGRPLRLFACGLAEDARGFDQKHDDEDRESHGVPHRRGDVSHRQ